jgi:hypothetical protein
MEKHTISALIVAGAGVLGAVVQVLVLRAAKKGRLERERAESEERQRAFDEAHGIEEPDES